MLILDKYYIEEIIMCEMCDGLTETIRIEHPYEYFNIISQVKNLICDGLITIEKSNCKLEDVEKGKPFPDDILYMFLNVLFADKCLSYV
jgi:hypothetical protein